MLPSKNVQMKISQLTGCDTTIVFGHVLLPSYLCILPTDAVFFLKVFICSQ